MWLKKSILIIDNNSLFRHAVRFFLEKEKCFEVSESENEKALSLLQNQNFDLLLVDIDEEKSKGIKLINKIRSKRHSVPIMVLSSCDMQENQILSSESIHVIKRPFTMPSLIKVVKEKVTLY